MDEVRRARYRREWAARRDKLAARYFAIVAELGAYCGANCDPELGCGAAVDLQLHHRDGKGWRSRDVGPLRRIKLLEEDHARGELGVLCRACNEVDGGRRTDHYRRRKVAAPF